MTDSATTRYPYPLALVIVAIATAIGLAFRQQLGVIDVVMIYLLAVVVAGSRFHGGPALLVAALSVAAFDFFFVPPFYTFNVQDTRFYLTFVVMLVVGLAMTRLTTRIREQAEEARASERLTAALYGFNQEITGVDDRGDLVAIAASHLSRAAQAPAEVVLVDSLPRNEHGQPNWLATTSASDLDAGLTASRAAETRASVGWGSDRYAEADALAVPLTVGGEQLGMVIVRREHPDQLLDHQARVTVEALAHQVALALARAMAAERHELARVALETERLRTSLLSALSHDLRTPLSTIEGAASSLVQDGDTMAAASRLELSETIVEESRRMHQMVGNLLDMVRVDTGTLVVRHAWQPLEETLGVALNRLESRLGDHPVTIRLDPNLPLVPIDELLIEQVFINLLENAVKYTPAGTPIVISAVERDGAVEVAVRDAGPGIPPGQEEAVFERFYRVGSSGSGGTGLGLTICRGIIVAHGGGIWIEPSSGGGTTVRFTLPLGEVPPAPVIEAPA